ncbi:hypothetical protein D3C84_904010 [compost metagenome]
MPDIVQQVQGHGAIGRVDGQGEVVHPIGAAGDDVTHLIEQDLGTLAIGRLRIDCVEAARHIAAVQCQVVADAARPIRPEDMTELGLHRGGRQGGAGDAIAACTTQ